MAHLHIVVDVDTDPTLEDPHEVADALLDHETPSPGYDSTFVAARWPLTRDQLRTRLLESFPGRTPDESDVLVATVAEMLDAVEALLNPPWES